MPYESGIQTETNLLHERFPLHHYLVGLVFLVFDIDVALIWVLVGTAVLGAAAGFLLGRRSRKD